MLTDTTLFGDKFEIPQDADREASRLPDALMSAYRDAILPLPWENGVLVVVRTATGQIVGRTCDLSAFQQIDTMYWRDILQSVAFELGTESSRPVEYCIVMPGFGEESNPEVFVAYGSLKSYGFRVLHGDLERQTIVVKDFSPTNLEKLPSPDSLAGFEYCLDLFNLHKHRLRQVD